MKLILFLISTLFIYLLFIKSSHAQTCGNSCVNTSTCVQYCNYCTTWKCVVGDCNATGALVCTNSSYICDNVNRKCQICMTNQDCNAYGNNLVCDNSTTTHSCVECVSDTDCNSTYCTPRVCANNFCVNNNAIICPPTTPDCSDSMSQCVCNSTSCGDPVYCNGAEICLTTSGSCAPGTPVTCNKGYSCNETAKACTANANSNSNSTVSSFPIPPTSGNHNPSNTVVPAPNEIEADTFITTVTGKSVVGSSSALVGLLALIGLGLLFKKSMLSKKKVSPIEQEPISFNTNNAKMEIISGGSTDATNQSL